MFKFLHDIDVAKRKLLNTINNKLALPNEDDECLFPGDEQTMSRALGARECSLPRKGDPPNGEGDGEEGDQDGSSESDKDDTSESDKDDTSESDKDDTSESDKDDTSESDKDDTSESDKDDSSESDQDNSIESSESDEDDSVESSGDSLSESDGGAKRSVRNGHEEDENREDEDEVVAAGGAVCRRKDAAPMCTPPQGGAHVQSASEGRREKKKKAQKGQPLRGKSLQGSERRENGSVIAVRSEGIECDERNEAEVDETKKSYLPKLKKETKRRKKKNAKDGTNILAESTFYNHLKYEVAKSLCCKKESKQYDEVVKQMILLRELSGGEANSMVGTEKGQSTERNCSHEQYRKLAEQCATKICDLVLGDRRQSFGKPPLVRSGGEKDEKKEKDLKGEEDQETLTNDEKEKTKNAKEIIELKRRNKILSDINERQTKQLLQLSCQLSSNIKSDSEKSEQNYMSARVDSMERELTQLKGEVAMLEEMASDKNVHVKKNYELGCLIKSLEASLQEKSHLCVSLWREKQELQERLQRCREQVQLSREDLRACRSALLDMQRREKRLAFQFRGLLKTRGDRAKGMSMWRHRRKGRLKLRGRSESGACNDSAGEPSSDHPNGADFERHPISVYPPRRTSSADPPRCPPAAPESQAASYCTNRCANRNALEELSRKVKNYKFFLDEWKSLSVRNKTKKDAELKETKKLLLQQVAKNEMLEKIYQALLEKMRSLDRGAHTDKGNNHMDSGMGNVTDGGVHCDGSHQEEGVCPQTKELLDEVNFLTSEVDKLREDQLLLQEDVKKKSTIIVHLIKKHALSEQHFRLDNSLPILNNKLTYDEIRKIMEETLVENIRLRSGLVTLAKCVKGNSAGSCAGQVNPGV